MTVEPRARKRWLLAIGLALSLGLVAVLVFGALPVTATSSTVPPVLAAPADRPAQAPGVTNDYCLECHGQPGQIRTLPSGESQYMTIDRFAFDNSVHGQGGYACVQCHTTIREYPHPESTAQDLRDVSLQNYTTCQQCHSGQYEKQMDSVHAAALEAGDRNAAVCTDCHNPHYQKRLTNPTTGDLWPNARLLIPQTCARCHSTIFAQYKDSVHGTALLGNAENPGGNPDVPTCIDCHGVHSQADPTTVEFRLSSTELCAKCHTDPARMDKYDITTKVLSTYLADFHGTTVTLFQKTAPDQQTNKPVCYDCHGIHDIKAVNDPQKGLQVKQNLLMTCQQCHPGATPDFPDSWLSHYEPSTEKNPLVYFVDLFYRFFIPGVLVPMGVYVVVDAGRRLYTRLKKGGTH